MNDYKIRSVTVSDLDFILKLNQNSLSAVSKSSLEQLVFFLNVSPYFKIFQVKSVPVGFLIGLGPGISYSSENYIWLSQRYRSFFYVDRIIIDAKYRNKGIGFHFYDHLINTVKNEVECILCEVNVKPLNEQSLNFHKKYGFNVVGEKDTENGLKRVCYLMYTIGPKL